MAPHWVSVDGAGAESVAVHDVRRLVPDTAGSVHTQQRHLRRTARTTISNDGDAFRHAGRAAIRHSRVPECELRRLPADATSSTTAATGSRTVAVGRAGPRRRDTRVRQNVVRRSAVDAAT